MPGYTMLDTATNFFTHIRGKSCGKYLIIFWNGKQCKDTIGLYFSLKILYVDMKAQPVFNNKATLTEDSPICDLSPR